MDIKQIKLRLKREAPDLYRYVRMRKIKKAIKILLLDTVILSLTWFTLAEMNRVKNKAVILFCVIAICFLYSFLAKPRGLLFGKSWYAAVENKYEQTVKENEGFVRIYTQFENVRYVFLELKNEKEETKTVRLPAHCSRGYEVGDKLLFYNGLHFPFVTENTEKEKIVCSRCGAVNEKNNSACVDCKISLFKIS